LGSPVPVNFRLESGALRFEAQVTDAMHGRLLHALDPVTVAVDSATAGVDLLRQRVAAVLAARFDWPDELREITGRSQPPTYAAYAEFVEGMELFIAHDQFERAMRRFEQARTLDTTFHLPRLYTSLMYFNLGKFAQVDSVLRSVAFHQARLSPYDRVLLEHLQALLVGDYEAGLRTSRRLNAMAPGSLLAGHSVLAVFSNRPREAVEVLYQLDLERGILRGWASYSYFLTTAQHMLGEHRRELKEARQGRVRQPVLQSVLLTEVRALAALGQVREVERLLRASLTLPSEQGWTPADVMLSAAAELRAHGEVEAATRVLENAIAWYDSRPGAEQPYHRPALARALYAAERWTEARALLEELAIAQPASVEYLGRLGTLSARMGERGEAERISTALASSTQPYLRGAHTLWRARIAAQLGEREQALLLLRAALSQGQPYELWLHIDPDLDPLWDFPPFRELMRPKG
jgi:tetratricopeptide (TPR) repeat protein